MKIDPPEQCGDCVEIVRQAVAKSRWYAKWFKREYDLDRFNYCQDCAHHFTFGEQLELGDIAKAVTA